MESSTLFDSYISAACWTGLLALLLTFLVGLQIVRLRFALLRHQRNEARAIVKWRPVLNAAVLGESPQDLPILLADERLSFLKLWVHLQSSMRGDAQDLLSDLARRLQLDVVARTMLAQGVRAERLLAMLVLGYLRDREAWPKLLQLTGQADNALSLNAMWALVRIDPQAAAEKMTTSFIERESWAISRVDVILQEAREEVSSVLDRLLPQLDAGRLSRALQLAETLRLNLSAETLGNVLRSTEVPLVIGGLRNVNIGELVADVRTLTTHEDWQVRVQAAKALGRIGSRNDIPLLVSLMQDRQWWVRYRAAEALAGLPGLSSQELDSLRSSLPDRYAADMLQHVMAEKESA